MGKVISIFIDESGDVGFIKDASKYYIITFVMHNQNDDIKSNIENFNFSNNQILIDFMKEDLNDELFDFIREDEEFNYVV